MKSILSLTVVLALAGVACAGDEPAAVFPRGMLEPQVAVGPDGHVAIAAANEQGSIEVAVSTDGKTFEKPVVVAKVEKLSVGMRRGPRIAATDKSLVVTAVCRSGEKDGVLQSWRSTDAGKTWQGPVVVSPQGVTGEGLDGLAAGLKDDVACVWLDGRNKATEVWSAFSDDGGATWKTEALVYHSPDDHVCECCHPSVTFGPKGDLAAMWRNWLGGSRDMWLARSTDKGKTWVKPEKLGEGTWPNKMCPMDGGAVAGTGDTFVTIWMRASEIFVAPRGKAERSLGAGFQGWIAPGPGGAFAVWLEKRGGDVFALTPAGKKSTIAQNASDPSVAGAVDGKGPVVAAWQSSAGVSARVLAPRK